MPTEWQQFSAPVEDAPHVPVEKVETNHQNVNPWADDPNFELPSSNDGVLNTSEDSKQLAEESPMSAPKSPNPFAQPEDFAMSRNDDAWRTSSPRLPPITTHNPFADDHVSVKSSEEVFTATASHQRDFIKDAILDSAFHHTGLPQLQVYTTIPHFMNLSLQDCCHW